LKKDESEYGLCALGCIYLGGYTESFKMTDRAEAQRLFERADEKYSSPFALLCLANLMEILGPGAPGFEKALAYYRRSAGLGNAGAQHALARSYWNGFLGLSVDYAQARKYAELAAEQNFPDAQALLGLVYLNGAAIEKDEEKAFMYLQLAAEQNCPNAYHSLGSAYCAGKWFLGQNYDEGFKYLKLGYDQGVGYHLLVELGGLYEKGLGTVRNPKLALKCYKSAIDRAPVSTSEDLKAIAQKLYDTLYNSPEIQREVKLVCRCIDFFDSLDFLVLVFFLLSFFFFAISFFFLLLTTRNKKLL
jgi:TPR repeat protein